MKIGFVCPYSLSRPGGVRTHILALKKKFEEMGENVKIIAPFSFEKKNYGRDVILLGNSIPIPGNSSISDLSFYFEIGNKSIYQRIEEEKFDLLHFHEPFVPFLSLQLLMASNIPNIVTFHAFLEKSFFYDRFFPVIDFLKRYFSPKIKGAIAVSSPVKEMYDDIYKGKIEIIPNGVDIKKFNPDNLPLEQYKDGKINILFVGRLEERKGVKYLLESWEKLTVSQKSLRLILIGDGPLRKEVAEKIKTLPRKENIVWKKNIREELLPDYYATADIFVSPATHAESFGIVLLEAMASGKPIVAFANRGYSLILKEQAKHSLSENRNSGVLALKIERLVEDKKLRESLGEWGAEEAKKYEWGKIAQEIVSFYKKLLF